MRKFLIVFVVLSAALSSSTAVMAAAPVMVSTKWLAKHVNDKHMAIIDMSAEDSQYARFHLPGAVRLPYYMLILRQKKSEKFPRRISDDALAHNLGIMGISQSHRIIIYDDMGGLQAARLFWHLERLGHNNVSVLNGGLVKWILEGRKVTNKTVKRTRTAFGPRQKTKDNEASLADVKAAAEQNGTRLVDVRSLEEYTGDAKRRQGGHIPAAIWWPWEQALDTAAGFKLKPVETLRQLFKQKGIENKKQPLIAYCQSGHRAAHTYLALRHLGFINVKLYVNSMNEYAADKSARLNMGGKP